MNQIPKIMIEKLFQFMKMNNFKSQIYYIYFKNYYVLNTFLTNFYKMHYYKNIELIYFITYNNINNQIICNIQYYGIINNDAPFELKQFEFTYKSIFKYLLLLKNIIIINNIEIILVSNWIKDQ